MENFTYNINLEFENTEFNELISNLNSCYEKNQNNFCKIAFCVFKISKYFDTHYVGKEKNTNEYYDKNKLLLKFGFDKSSVSRLINCYLRFMTGTDFRDINLKSWYYGFSPSKLFELLKLSDKTLEDDISKGFINSDMTVKEIREYIKFLSNGKDKAEKVLQDVTKNINEDEIPLVYNPKQHYDFDYFQDKTKSQLLNMIWELQKEYEKIKGKIKK